MTVDSRLYYLQAFFFSLFSDEAARTKVPFFVYLPVTCQQNGSDELSSWGLNMPT